MNLADTKDFNQKQNQSRLEKTWRQGYAFKNEKIYIFGKSRVLVARGWPHPMAWSKTKTIPWHPTRKWADEMLGLEMYQYSATGNSHIKSLGFDSYADLSTDAYWQQKHEAVFGAFSKTYPEDIFNAAMQFPERKWQLLCLLSRCPEALELFHSNPAILFCLANNWIFHKPIVVNSMRAARALIKKKQRDILFWLGFPGTERTRLILSKIEASEVTVEMLLYLRDTLNRNDNIKYLSHLPILNRDVLRILCDPRISKILTYSALEQTATQSHHASFVPNIINLLSINDAATHLGLNILKSINNVDNIIHYHEKIMLKLDSIQLVAEDTSLRLPSPPFSGTETIKPLRTKNSLEIEGKRMQNCVAARLDNVLAGRECIYHVTFPISATLSVCKAENGIWGLCEMKGFANKAIDPTIVNKVLTDLLDPSNRGVN